MNEIEKMMQNANVKKHWNSTPYGGVEEGYPPFTAEKQLEIVKFLLHKGVYYDADGDTYWFHYTDEIENATYRPFKEAIAEFINGLWQDLTAEEKEALRGILRA